MEELFNITHMFHFIYLGKFHHDLTVLPHYNHSKGNHPKMAELFRLVKYYNFNLPRYMR